MMLTVMLLSMTLMIRKISSIHPQAGVCGARAAIANDPDGCQWAK